LTFIVDRTLIFMLREVVAYRRTGGQKLCLVLEGNDMNITLTPAEQFREESRKETKIQP
jgi:Ethanolamine utilization protein EutJ (predicted chaperonin)